MRDMTVTQQVASRIKRLRLQHGWTAQQLAEESARVGKTSLTRSTIAKIESGVRKSITADELTVLAQALGVTLGDLIDAEESQAKHDGLMELREPSQVKLTTKIYNLPRPPSAVFAGRLEVQERLDQMINNGSEHVINGQVMYGMGGVGKSELALQYAFAHRDRYSVVWWISAENIEQIQDSLAALAGRLHPPVRVAGTVEEAADWAMGWLQSHSDWLLVLDDVDNPKHVDFLLGQLSSGHVIITTRRNVHWGGQIQSTSLDVLEPEAAVELIYKIIDIESRGGDEAIAAEIAARLGFLPLALVQAATYIAQNRISLERYLDRLREDPVRMYSRTAEGGEVQQAISRLWQITISTIGDRSPEVVELLRILACYAPGDLPRQVLPEYIGDKYVDEALGVLASYSMITLTEHSIRMHDLMQAVVLADTSNNLNQIDYVQKIALTWLADALPVDPAHNLASWPLWRRLMPHIYALADRYVPGDEPTELGDVLNQAAVFQSAQGVNQRAVELADRALAIAEAVYGPDHPDVARSLGNLASSFRALGRPGEAVPLFQRALAINETAYGPEHPYVAISLGNLANSFSDLGRLGEAVPLFQRALAINETAYGPEHPYVAISLGNLANSFSDLGRLGEAVPLFQRALAINETAYGPEHPDVAISLGNLASSFRALGRPGEAVPLEQRALAIAEAVHG
ncbi:FxSxx-COOH system tetratricopeptide repeat protein, partial [Streptosporangium sp. NPDC000563]|uniref:FxSxx-COOH system tetratricopeptide repeat protein n=1 Tax=Streptosporangium sp. NPDC000563 TaxID=3154366 RepID=UPI00332EFFBE